MVDQTPSIDVLEKYLVEYYVRNGLSSSDQDHRDRNLAKARALNTPYMFFRLAECCKEVRQYTKALDFFSQAFDQGLSDPFFLERAGECFLRHGTIRQYSTLFTKLYETDPSDRYSSFILDTITFYNTTVYNLMSEINSRQVPYKELLIINVALFGSKYIEIFSNYLLAILMSKNNILFASEKYELHFIIATTRADFNTLSGNSLFHELESHARVHFVEFPEDLLSYSIDYSRKRGGEWTIPITFLTNAQHYAAIECARFLDASIINLWPDHIIPDSFLFDLLNAGEQYGVVSGLAFRLFYDQNLLGEINRYRDATGVINIPYEKMFGLLYDYLPYQNYVNADSFSKFPIYLCWKIDGEGIIAHVNHYTPFLIKGNCLKGPIYPSLDPVDGFFLDRYMIDKSALGLASEKVIVFDLGNNPLVCPTDGSPFNPEQVAAWLKPWLTDVHQKYFEQCMKYPVSGSGSLDVCGGTISMARSVVGQIITRAKEF